MRILIITQRFPPDAGGTSTRAWNAVKGLVKRGHKIVVVTTLYRARKRMLGSLERKALVYEMKDDVKIIRVWVPATSKRLILYIAFSFSSLFALFSVGRIDVVWAIENPPVFMPGFIYRFVKRSPLVLDIGDLWPDVLRDLGILKSNFIITIMNTLINLSYKLAEAIVTTSPALKRAILAKKIERSKIHVVEEGVDTEIFHPVEVDKASFGQEFQGKFVVMYSGNLGAAYDFDTVLMAAKFLSPYKDILFVIRGRGESEKKLMRLLLRLKLKNTIVLTEFVSSEMLVKILNLADVFLLPMKNVEMFVFPTKIYEYLACGKPIICCAEGEPVDLIRTIEAGLAVRPEDPKSLASAILSLYEDVELRKNLSENGPKYVSEQLSYDEIGKRLETIFASMRAP